MEAGKSIVATTIWVAAAIAVATWLIIGPPRQEHPKVPVHQLVRAL